MRQVHFDESGRPVAPQRARLPVILTTAVLSKYLGIPERDLEAACASGAIPSRRAGKHYLIGRDALCDWLEGLAVAVPSWDEIVATIREARTGGDA